MLLSSTNPLSSEKPDSIIVNLSLFGLNSQFSCQEKMDSFNFCDIKLEKANALKKHRQLQKIANLFRLIEICLVLALISRFSIQLPVAVKNSSGYFKDILISPRFIFVLGNVLVIILFAKSGQFSGHDSTGESPRTNLYQEFVEKSQGTHRNEAGYRDKQITCVKYTVSERTNAALESKPHKRSQSQNFERPNSNRPSPELKRSMTESYQKKVDSGKALGRDSYPEDNLSNEEFRCAVEAFIARQKRFRIDEENSVFLE